MGPRPSWLKRGRARLTALLSVSTAIALRPFWHSLHLSLARTTFNKRNTIKGQKDDVFPLPRALRSFTAATAL